MVVDMSIVNQKTAPAVAPRVYKAVPRDRRVERLQEELVEYRRSISEINSRLTEAKFALETANLENARLANELDAANAEIARLRAERKPKSRAKAEPVKTEPLPDAEPSA
jgi:chromosome segregation ATPase